MIDSSKNSQSASNGTSEVYRFGNFELNTTGPELRRGGQPVPLTPKALETLIVLVRGSDRLVGKDEVIAAVWPDTFVEDGVLAQNILTLRKALQNPDWIETVPKRGYRFRAPVTRVDTRGSKTRSLIWWGSAILVLASAAGGLAWMRAERSAARRADLQIRSIAVLPFHSIPQQPSYLGLGLADVLINRLGTLAQISVRPTNAIRKFADLGVDPVAAGRELSVDAVLDGNLQRDGEHIRVTVQLIRVSDGAAVWTAKFDQAYRDLFTLEDSIAVQVADGLMVNLTAGQRRQLTRPSTANPEAWEAYVRGRYYWNRRTSEGHLKAIEEFEEATRIDPHYSLAYAGLADAYVLLGSNPNRALPRHEAMARARAAALRAIELDDRLAEAHTPLAFILMHYDWKWAEAEKEFERALALNPSYATAHQWHAINLLVTGHPEAAIEEIKKAMALDPTSLIIGTDLAEIYLYANRPVDAEGAARRVLELDPTFLLARVRLAWSLQAQRRFADAVAQMPEELFGDDPERLIVLAGSDAAMGKPADVRRVLDRLVRQADNNHAEFQVAEAYGSIGDVEHMLPWLQRAFTERDGALLLLNVIPQFAPVRADARFQAFAARVGLAPPLK